MIPILHLPIMGAIQIKWRGFRKLAVLAALLLLSPGSAPAQTCDVIAEEIVKLRAPAFANYLQWDQLYGKDGMEQFSDVAVLIDGSVVAAGSYTKDDKDPVYKPLLVHMTEKGKVLWETREEETKFKTINRIAPFKDGYVVLGDLSDPKRGDGIYVALYSREGKRKNQWGIYEKGSNLDGKAVVPAPDGTSLIIAAQVNPGGGAAGQYGVLYRYTMSGKQVWRHGYSPGLRSVFNNMTPAPDGGYIVTGSVQTEDARMSGWLLRVDDSGAVMWQRHYARGSFGTLTSSAVTKEGDILLSGEVKPVGGKRSSAWVMKIDPAGNTLWQRYYAGAYGFTAQDVIAYHDGRAIVLVDAVAQNLKDISYGMFMMFTPRGYLMNIDEFSQEQGARVFRMKLGPTEERVTVGYAQTKYADTLSPLDIPVNTFDGWIAAGVPLDPYDDPCLPKSYLP